MINLIEYLTHIFNLSNIEPGAFFCSNKNNKENISLLYNFIRITALLLSTIRTYRGRDY